VEFCTKPVVLILICAVLTARLPVGELTTLPQVPLAGFWGAEEKEKMLGKMERGEEKWEGKEEKWREERG